MLLRLYVFVWIRLRRIAHRVIQNNRKVLVGSFVCWFVCDRFRWGIWDNIYECVCCYNRCHGKVVKGFWAVMG
jgi:hypothetical protein